MTSPEQTGGAAERFPVVGRVLEDNQVEPLLPQIAKAYVGAFAGEPWYEVSSCADEQTPRGCGNGFSPLTIGETCPHCNKVLTTEAYNQEELQTHFKGAMGTRPHAWYVEEVQKEQETQLALASFAWETDAQELVNQKYEGREEMRTFFETIAPEGRYVWLDEVFADRSVRASGNLRNFKQMILGLGQKLGAKKILYRTINEAMIRAATRDFPEVTTVYREPDVPDRRAVVCIDLARLPV